MDRLVERRRSRHRHPDCRLRRLHQLRGWLGRSLLAFPREPVQQLGEYPGRARLGRYRHARLSFDRVCADQPVSR